MMMTVMVVMSMVTMVTWRRLQPSWNSSCCRIGGRESRGGNSCTSRWVYSHWRSGKSLARGCWWEGAWWRWVGLSCSWGKGLACWRRVMLASRGVLRVPRNEVIKELLNCWNYVESTMHSQKKCNTWYTWWAILKMFHPETVLLWLL